jgi:hypothetical protein
LSSVDGPRAPCGMEETGTGMLFALWKPRSATNAEKKHGVFDELPSSHLKLRGSCTGAKRSSAVPRERRPMDALWKLTVA